MLAEDLLQAFQRGKHAVYRFVIGILAGSKTGLVHSVVYRVVNPAVERIDLFTQFCRVVISSPCADGVESAVEHADNIGRLIADDGLLLFIPQHWHGNTAAVLRIGP
ncbi:hypothetical protein D3C75_1183930 [compost metagenome]